MAKSSKKAAIKPATPGFDTESIKRSLMNRLVFTIGKDEFTATPRDWFYALAFVVRDHLIDRWMQTMRGYYYNDVKRVYYLSLEFLIGRTLLNSVLNLAFYNECRDALHELGFELLEISAIEDDAALGNGGLGRLAACFLDSMATLQLPGYGYGIRYEYGMFNQGIENGYQVEHPEHWLRYGNPWEFPRPEVLYRVKFYGKVQQYRSDDGIVHHHWTDCEEVMAMAYDTPIPGYQTPTVNNMRLWSAKGSRSFDLKYFNEGNYIKAVEEKNQSETLSRILYPSDSTLMGRELRLKQEYFFVSASLQDILLRYLKHHPTFTELPDKVAIQLNDTHPAIAIAELMYILVDIHHLGWEEAWSITTRIFSYTNHTLMPEALETWPVELFSQVLPRHMQIIFEINHRFLQAVMYRCPGDVNLLRRLSIIDEEQGQRIRMSHLAIVGSHKVNGVAELHTQLMQQTIFADFYQLYPEKFINITNGVTPRRWLNHCNRALAALITQQIGKSWQQNLNQLTQLVPLATDADFVRAFQAIKRQNKQQLATLIQQQTGVVVSLDSLFDVQIKRIHEYKRQLLNVLQVITRYNEIRQQPALEYVPRTVIIAGKAAPGYRLAKLIIKLINDVASIVNHDPLIGERLKVVFMPNYNVTLAEQIIPAAELSQQISTAGTEASGTGNMKLAMNGALTLGTLDGANIEIMDAVGRDNIFIFGLNAAEASALRQTGYHPNLYYQANPPLREAIDMIRSGFFSPDDRQRFHPITDSLLMYDSYLLLADYQAYLDCQRQIDAVYRQPAEWSRRAILNVANMGKFSSDRTIQQYAQQIWNIPLSPPLSSPQPR